MIRLATEADEQALHELWQEFVTEVPEPGSFEPDSWEEDWASLRENMRDAAVFLAEDDDGVLGFAEVSAAEARRWHLETVHVRPRARRRGVAKALVRECARVARERGAQFMSLEVLTDNSVGRAVWERLGFEPVELLLAAPLDVLERRLAVAPVGESRATTHVQTDDRVSVERALAQFVPRLESAEVRAGANGWLRIADTQLDHDRELQARFAGELSERLGAVVVALAVERGAVVRFRLYERGRMVDEYLSVPTYYGELAKGDELALAANPTLVARLTGADRDEVRRVARTASTPADLPPATELYERIARMLGLEP
ncbi:MAG: GNAT family N-acetyltransferase [Actinobacteria bacterium]|nr:GNAT family N-acetyltransferase [Actinomycetota bacterium]MBV8599324.1 GNAT family N-acetyltransferase [Actinomycetota bacterium]